MKKIVLNGFIIALSETAGIDITETERTAILNALAKKPEMSKTVGYKLKDSDLTWVAYQLDAPQDEETTVFDKAEAYDILMGVEA